jgi:hypothetical protein
MEHFLLYIITIIIISINDLSGALSMWISFNMLTYKVAMHTETTLLKTPLTKQSKPI